MITPERRAELQWIADECVDGLEPLKQQELLAEVTRLAAENADQAEYLDSVTKERDGARYALSLRDADNKRLKEDLHKALELVRVNRSRRGFESEPDPDWCYLCDRPKDDCACHLDAAMQATAQGGEK